MPQKKYTHLRRFSASCLVEVDKKQIRIEFTGGTPYPIKRNGDFYTSDPKLQKALETSKSFNVKWKLTGSWPTPLERKEAANKEIEEIKAAKPVIIPELEPDTVIVPDEVVPREELTEMEKLEPIVTPIPEPVIEEIVSDKPTTDGITTVQAAKEWLVNHVEGTTTRMVQNKVAVLEYAKSKNVVFPDLAV